MENLLTYMTFVPLAGAVVVLLLPNAASNLIRWVAAAATVPPLLMAVWLFNHFDRAKPGFQFIEKYQWIPAYNISYFMGVDGISISMVLLTALLCFI
jgi:NADH-quinone oxidoreductase subunit M